MYFFSRIQDFRYQNREASHIITTTIIIVISIFEFCEFKEIYNLLCSPRYQPPLPADQVKAATDFDYEGGGYM